MTKSSALRVAPAANGVSIWSDDIFGPRQSSSLREFLVRAFSVPEVEGVELRRSTAFSRIRFGAVPNPAQLWKKIGRALSSTAAAADEASVSGTPASDVDASLLYLDIPDATRVRVTRIGDSLTTWRVRKQGQDTVRLWHPFLRNRRDVIFRLEQELAAIFGVEEFRTSPLSGGVSIRFDKGALTVERLTRQLEKAWPRLREGLDGPPSRTRLVAATGLMGLALTGRFFVPAVRPFALAGMAVYSFPNLIRAARQLARGEVGVYSLYSTGLALMVISGSPLAASVIAVLMQLWPQLGRRKILEVQRRLFALQRQRPAFARVLDKDGSAREVNVEALVKNDRILVNRGEIIPVDGIVQDGYAILSGSAPFASDRFEDRASGDAVLAGALVADGSLTIRALATGAHTLASHVDALLRRSAIAVLPCELEAERVANRNAKPTLAAAAVSLLLTRRLRLSQALIRPDYLTAPRLAAQLSAAHAIGKALQRGVLFNNPAALDRLASVDTYLFDESAGLERRGLQVASVETEHGVSAELVVGYALVAQQSRVNDATRALTAFIDKRRIVLPKAESIGRSAGVTRYRDRKGRLVEIATPEHLQASNVALPSRFASEHGFAIERADARPSLRPVFVLRDGLVIGRVSFEPTGEIIGKAVLARLKAKHAQARVIWVAGARHAETRSPLHQLGIECHVGLSDSAKLDFLLGLGRPAVWIGDGSDPSARPSIAASAVSVSVTPLRGSHPDSADILLPDQGLFNLPDAIEIARAHARRLAQDYQTVYAANLLAVAGAFVARFGGLHAGLVSNFGTAVVYARHAKDLSSLVAGTERRRARLTSSLAR